MVAVAKQAGLLKKGDLEGAVALADDLIRRSQSQRARMQQNHDVYWNLHGISFPPGVSNESVLRSGTGKAQVRLLLGLMSKKPTSRVFTTTSSQGEKDRAQAIEDFDNTIFEVCETQEGPVWIPALEDLLLYGYSVDRLEFVPSRLSVKGGAPDPDGEDYAYSLDDPAETRDERRKAYQADRSAFVKSLGAPAAKLPLRWVHCPAPQVFFRLEDGEPSVVLEVRIRSLKSVLEDPLYAKKLPRLRAYYARMAAQDKATALGLRVRFCVLEDNHLCTYLVLPERDLGDTEDWRARRAQAAFGGDFGGELADQYPNLLGRPGYIITPAFISGSVDPARQWRGVIDDMLELIVARDSLMSYAVTRQKRFTFSPAVIQTQPQRFQGEEYDLEGDATGGEPTPVVLSANANEATRLRPGETIQFLTAPAPSADELATIGWIDRSIDNLGTPDALLSAHQDISGFALSKLESLILAADRVILENIRRAHTKRVVLLHDLQKIIGEPLSLLLVGDANKREAQWYELDPKALKGLEHNVQALFDISRPENSAQDISLYREAVASGAFNRERARQIYLHTEDSQRIERDRMIDGFLDMPEIQQIMLSAIARDFMEEIGRLQAQEQGQISADDARQMSPGLLRALQQETLPGAPGYDSLQAVTQAGGQPQQFTPTPAFNPYGTPGPSPTSQDMEPTSNRAGRGGRPAGLARRPGGPKKSEPFLGGP